jgi:hypothetical protein
MAAVAYRAIVSQGVLEGVASGLVDECEGWTACLILDTATVSCVLVPDLHCRSVRVSYNECRDERSWDTAHHTYKGVHSARTWYARRRRWKWGVDSNPLRGYSLVYFFLSNSMQIVMKKSKNINNVEYNDIY